MSKIEYSEKCREILHYIRGVIAASKSSVNKGSYNNILERGVLTSHIKMLEVIVSIFEETLNSRAASIEQAFRMNVDSFSNAIHTFYFELLDIINDVERNHIGDLRFASKISSIIERFDYLLRQLLFDFGKVPEQLKIEYNHAWVAYLSAKSAMDVEKEISKVVDAVKLSASEGGIRIFDDLFDKQISSHKKAALYWLIALMFLILLALVSIVVLFLYDHMMPWSIAAAPNKYAMVNQFASRLVFVSVIFYAIVFSAKNYYVNKHNWIVNIQKKTSASSLSLFVESGYGDDSKNQVLLKVLDSVISSHYSGYLSKEPEHDGSKQLVEVVGAGINAAAKNIPNKL